MGQPRPLFQTNINAIFTTDQCEKMSCPSSIWRWDLNPQPSELEPPPITTRPGLPPFHFSPYRRKPDLTSLSTALTSIRTAEGWTPHG